MASILELFAGIPINATQRLTITALEKRNSELESENKELKTKLARYEEKPCDRCPSCREYAFSLKSSSLHPLFGDSGAKDYIFLCGSCGFEDTVLAFSAEEALGHVRQQ